MQNLTLYSSSLITKREKQVLQLIAHECNTKEIAHELFVSYETAHSHRKNLLKKLKVKNTAGLIRVAFEKGFFSSTQKGQFNS